MAKDLSLAQGIDTDADFLNGNLKDGQTIVNEHINQDIVQFFQKLMSEAGLTANGNFDNETNGYQFIDALVKKMQGSGWVDASLNAPWVPKIGYPAIRYKKLGNGYVHLLGYAWTNSTNATTKICDVPEGSNIDMDYIQSYQLNSGGAISDGYFRIKTTGDIETSDAGIPVDLIFINVLFSTL